MNAAPLTLLQAGRAVAALMVVLYHTSESTRALFSSDIPGFITSALSYGYLGVDFFFVLSGFIIYYTASSSSGPADFLRKRLLRIYVPYLPIGLGIAALYTFAPEPGRDWSWLATATLLPTFDPPALSVAWTLQHELIFYAIFGLLYFSRNLKAGMVVWALGIILSWVLAFAPAGPLGMVLAPINLEFGFGVIAAHTIGSGRRLHQAIAAAGVLGALAVFVGLGALSSGRVAVGLAFAIAVIQLTQWELSGRIKAGRSWLFLGDASYSIYLVHYPAIVIILRVMGLLNLRAWQAGVLASFFGALLAGIAYHLVFERPARRFVAVRLKAMRHNKVQQVLESP